MSFLNKALAASIVMAMASSSALAAAESVRPSSTLATPSTQLAVTRMGARIGAPVKSQNDLLGAPLFLVFLGAVAITITTIILVNNNDNPASKG